MSQLPAPRSAAALPPEVEARFEVALRAQPAGEERSEAARGLYALLLRHGFARADVLSLAASLVDEVTSDVARRA